MRKLIALLLLVPLTISWANETKTFTWTPPTEYENGTALDNADLGEYRIYCNGSLLASVPNEPLNTNTYVTTLDPGDYSCTATAVTTAGIESAESNPANFTVVPGVPNPPAQFAIQ